jgi:hypothetical protein
MVSTSLLWVSNALPVLSTLQAMRASLLASAVASLLRCIRGAALVSHWPKLNFPILRSHQEHLGSLNEERSQVAAAALGVRGAMYRSKRCHLLS